MEQFMQYNEEILDYLKDGYGLDIHSEVGRDPNNDLTDTVFLKITVTKDNIGISGMINQWSIEYRVTPQNAMYTLVLGMFRELKRQWLSDKTKGVN